MSVTFFPPLFEQRQMWVLGVLRRENVKAVLDVGCGEGSLLIALCNPAPWLATPDRDSAERFKILRVSHLHGLDISSHDLQNTIVSTSPPSESSREYAYYSRAIRWEPLQVQIWKGSLASVNKAFIGVESIVSTEVIEHLHDEELSKFAPILLGVYHPRLLLITTPSYTFNARFTAPKDGSQSMPSDEDSKVRDGGFLDPTRRSKRVFRHPDHKFEWTIREFEEWCTNTAQKWGYTVHTGGIGKPMEEDGWGRDSELGYATQTAVFTRLDGAEHERLRAENAREYLQGSRRGVELLATHYHVPHPAVTSPPQSNEMILELIKEEIDRGEDNKILLRYLWIEERICCACSGRIGMLIGAINAAENVVRLHITDPGALEDWVVELIGSSKRRKENLWEDRQDDDADTYNGVPDQETEDQLEELEDIERENDDLREDVSMESEEAIAPSGWRAWGVDSSNSGNWGFRADESSHGGWGAVNHCTGDGGWGREDVGSSWEV